MITSATGTKLFNLSQITVTLAIVGAELVKRSGLEAQKVTYNKLMEGLAAPDTKYNEYHAKVVALSKEVGTQYKKDFERLNALGYDVDKSMAVAQKKAEEMFANELAILKLEHPISQNFMSIYEGKKGKGN